MKTSHVKVHAIKIVTPEEVKLSIQQYYDCLITMTDLVMHMHNLGWVVVRVSNDSITIQRNFGTDGSELLINIIIEL